MTLYRWWLHSACVFCIISGFALVPRIGELSMVLQSLSSATHITVQVGGQDAAG